MIYITKEHWNKHIKDYIFTGCAIRDKNIVYFCLRKDLPYEEASRLWDSEIPTMFLCIYLDTPNDPIDYAKWVGFDGSKVGVCLKPIEQGLLVSRGNDGKTDCMGSGIGWELEKIMPGVTAITNNIKCINGYAYFVGGGRDIYKRIDIGKWLPIKIGIPDGEVNSDMGFRDLDGFSEQDMYAVGGEGDVWHYNGEMWIPCGFPSNEQLSAVLCAPDGYVYIGGEGGSLWRGREFQWEKLYHGGSTILLNQLRWFEDKVWACDDYSLQCWDGNDMVRPMDGDKNVIASGHMDVRDGILVVANSYRVDLYDGTSWHKIVRPYRSKE
ncbi:hypothetical protein AB7315_20555 [Providencia manganoxydans]|uniref:hypothetical protein n=1 Tax=Providencia TaxID=586 RepID=UPI00111F4DE4|nr:hypothetical protein [Providencia stuartii]